jgi:flagellar biogenesis protein FliO
MTTTSDTRQGIGRERGLAAWLLGRLRGQEQPRPSLALLERITLAPRQSLALVEAEGRRFLVATSAEGSPTFHALDEGSRTTLSRRRIPGRTRVSW